MSERIKTIVIVSVLAFAFWIFAEAESLSERRVSTRISFQADPANRDTLRIRTQQGFEGGITLELRGPRAALDDVERELAAGIDLTRGDALLPLADGTFEVDLIEVFQSLETISSRTEVLSVRPQSVQVELRRFEEIDLPVAVDLVGVEAEAAPTISPASARVRLPSEFARERNDERRALATINPGMLQDRPAGETVSVQVRPRLPEEWRGDDEITLLSPEFVTVSLSVRSTRDEASVDAVLWTTLPIGDAGRFDLTVDAADRRIPVRVSGPAEPIARIESGEWPIVAVVALDGTELLQQTISKDIRYFALVGGGLRALPPSVEVESERTALTIGVARGEDAP